MKKGGGGNEEKGKGERYDGGWCEFSIRVRREGRKEKKEHSGKKSVRAFTQFSSHAEAFFHRKVRLSRREQEVI